MKRAGKILTVAAVALCIVFTAPMIAKGISEKKEDAAKKEPIKQEVELIDSPKSLEELGVQSVSVDINGENATLELTGGKIKFAAGCIADGFIANVNGVGSVPIEYEYRTVYTSDSKYELYTLKSRSLTPGTIFGTTTEFTVDIYAHTCGRLYKIKTVKCEVTGAFDIWGNIEPDENELPLVPIN